MFEREKDLIDAFVRGKMGRRELIKGLGAMGVTTATAGMLLNAAQSRALAADFDWQRHAGTTIKLLLNKHPYMEMQMNPQISHLQER